MPLLNKKRSWQTLQCENNRNQYNYSQLVQRINERDGRSTVFLFPIDNTTFTILALVQRSIGLKPGQGIRIAI